MSQPLAQIRPARIRADNGTTALSPRQKAAVIVRYLMSEGALPPLTELPEHLQAALTEQIGQMQVVDRDTLAFVVQEFLGEVDAVGLTFPGGIEGALGLMGAHISTSAASKLRRLAGASTRADPWDRVAALQPERLAQLLEGERVEIAAVALSKLPVPRAADILGRMPGERARRVALAMSRTAAIAPETVHRIGAAFAAELDSTPVLAFDAPAVDRVGAILNAAASGTREAILAGLDEEDGPLAEAVRKSIFTFAHIPDRLSPRDVAKVLRLVEPAALVTAVAAALVRPDMQAAAEFLLANLSQRMAQSLRDEAAERGRVKDKDGDAAMAAVVAAIRQLEASGEVVLILADEVD
jgi:flagellar motor switch protein FliG